MSRDAYIMHVTLDTGHGRRSYRDEVADAVVTIVKQDLAAVAEGLSYEIRPGYRLKPSRAGASLVATVMNDTIGPLVTVAVVGKSRDSAKVWEVLRAHFGAVGDPPQPPWCAVKLHPALADDPIAATWLGDYERCLAWAWLERGA